MKTCIVIGGLGLTLYIASKRSKKKHKPHAFKTKQQMKHGLLCGGGGGGGCVVCV